MSGRVPFASRQAPCESRELAYLCLVVCISRLAFRSVRLPYGNILAVLGRESRNYYRTGTFTMFRHWAAWNVPAREHRILPIYSELRSCHRVSTRFQKAPIEFGRRRYAISFEGLIYSGCNFDPHRPYPPLRVSDDMRVLLQSDTRITVTHLSLNH